ncbi:MAG: flavodoxin domain-containing protein [Candidatus Thorarchaeota archaeon]
MTNALIIYGTRYGATSTTAEKISQILSEEGFTVRVVEAKKEKIKDISEYDLIIVGSGMRMFRWVSEPENFIKKFQKVLREKKTALFVSSGAQALHKHNNNTEELDKAWSDYLVRKTEKYSIQPISMAIFGGIWDYNQMGFPFKQTMEPFKEELRKAGIKETEPGVFDTRDWEEIESWTRELAHQVNG